MLNDAERRKKRNATRRRNVLDATETMTIESTGIDVGVREVEVEATKDLGKIDEGNAVIVVVEVGVPA